MREISLPFLPNTKENNLKVISPVVFQESHLLSTTAVETVADYNAGTTYALGDKVRYEISIYESLEAGNAGNTPSTATTKWLRISPDNKHAMFDEKVNTQTTATSPLVVVLRPLKQVTSLAFLGIEANDISIQVQDGVAGPVVYTKDISLDNTIIFDWYSYFFEQFDLSDTGIALDLPPYGDPVLTITFVGGSGIKVGTLIYGEVSVLGLTQFGINFGIRDYSLKETDDFGNTTFVRRAFSRRASPSIYVENAKLRYVNKVLEGIRATPTVWIGSDEQLYDPLIIYGFYKDYNIDIAYPSHSMMSIDIEGLI